MDTFIYMYNTHGCMYLYRYMQKVPKLLGIDSEPGLLLKCSNVQAVDSSQLLKINGAF